MASEQVEREIKEVLAFQGTLVRAHNQVCDGFDIVDAVLLELDMRITALENVVGTTHAAELTALRDEVARLTAALAAATTGTPSE